MDISYTPIHRVIALVKQKPQHVKLVCVREASMQEFGSFSLIGLNASAYDVIQLGNARRDIFVCL